MKAGWKQYVLFHQVPNIGARKPKLFRKVVCLLCFDTHQSTINKFEKTAEPSESRCFVKFGTCGCAVSLHAAVVGAACCRLACRWEAAVGALCASRFRCVSRSRWRFGSVAGRLTRPFGVADGVLPGWVAVCCWCVGACPCGFRSSLPWLSGAQFWFCSEGRLGPHRGCAGAWFCRFFCYPLGSLRNGLDGLLLRLRRVFWFWVLLLLRRVLRCGGCSVAGCALNLSCASSVVDGRIAHSSQKDFARCFHMVTVCKRVVLEFALYFEISLSLFAHSPKCLVVIA